MNHVWLNGEILRVDEAKLPVTDHGLLYGAGFFETFRTFGRKTRNLEAHLFLLRNSYALLGLEPDFTGVSHGIGKLLDKAGLPDAVFRLTVTAGTPDKPGLAPVYQNPSVFLTLRPLPPPPPAAGSVLRVLKTVRSTPEVFPRPKSLNYLNNLLAARELASSTPPADEGLMLTAEGFVCEGVVTNLSWVRGNVLHIPCRTLGALPGLTQQGLADAWKNDGGVVVETRVKSEDLRDADGLVLSNSVRGPFQVGRLILPDGEVLDFPAWPLKLQRLANRWTHADE